MNLIVWALLTVPLLYISFLAFRTITLRLEVYRCFEIEEEDLFYMFVDADNLPKLDHLVREVKVHRDFVSDEEHRVEFTMYHTVQHVGLMKSSGMLRVDAENLKVNKIVTSFYGLVQSISEYEFSWESQQECTKTKVRHVVNCPNIISGFINKTLSDSLEQVFNTLQFILDDKTINWRKELLKDSR